MISRRVCLAAVVALGLTACFGSGPEAAVQGFYGAVAEGNTDKAMGFLALECFVSQEGFPCLPRFPVEFLQFFLYLPN